MNVSFSGCTIKVEVLRGNDEEVEVLSLPVALHSPLEVLREQLENLTNIEMTSQVLILCDLTDAERNSDVLLQGRDHMSLRDCNIRNGSVLTLHALGLGAQRKISSMKGIGKLKSSDDPEAELILSISTPISAAQANHSYNGIIFDVESKGPYEVDITSISLGGMLGRVVRFTLSRPLFSLTFLECIFRFNSAYSHGIDHGRLTRQSKGPRHTGAGLETLFLPPFHAPPSFLFHIHYYCMFVSIQRDVSY